MQLHVEQKAWQVVLTTLLKVYVRGGLFEKSRELLTELEVLGYTEEEMPYCLLMDALSKARKIDEAKLVFSQMKRKSMKTDGYSYSIMIYAFRRHGLLDDAKELATEFEAKYEKYDVVILNAMLCAYCRTREMENVMNLMKKMDELAINPDQNTFHILIKYFRKEKLYMLAFKTLQDMHNRGQQPDEFIMAEGLDAKHAFLMKIGTRVHAARSIPILAGVPKHLILLDHHQLILHCIWTNSSCFWCKNY